MDILSFDFSKELELPEGWRIQKYANKVWISPPEFGRIQSCFPIECGDFNICIRGTNYRVMSQSKPGRKQFENQFPIFPYFKDEYLNDQTNQRISRLENRLEAIVSHLETIMVMLGERAADADPLQLTGS